MMTTSTISLGGWRASRWPSSSPPGCWTRLAHARCESAWITRWTCCGTGDGRGPARHASLERVIQSSWDLLDEAEQEALAALSVFRGGFTIVAAEAVLGAGAISLLHRLRTKSLLRLLAGPDHRPQPL